MTEPKPKPAPTRAEFDDALRYLYGAALTLHNCGDDEKETITKRADAKEAEIASLRDALRDMEIALIEAQLIPEHPIPARRLALLDRLAILREADAGEGGR